MRNNYNIINKSPSKKNKILSSLSGIPGISSPLPYFSKRSKDIGEDTIIESDSKIRNILKFLKTNNKPFENLRFLILLSDDNYVKKLFQFHTKKHYIKKMQDKFPGKLIIDKYSNFDNKYKFEDVPISNKVYVELPKEKVFVLFNDFEVKLLDSKFNEFYDILATVGAKHIKMSKIISNHNDNTRQIQIGLNSVGTNTIGTNNQIYIKNEKNNSMLLNQEMHFNNEKDPDLNKLINNNYFYLPYTLEWHNMLIRRIENNETKMKYKFQYNEFSILNFKLKNKLCKFNIETDLNLDYFSNKISSFEIEYEINYYSIKDKNINNNLIINNNSDNNILNYIEQFKNYWNNFFIK